MDYKTSQPVYLSPGNKAGSNYAAADYIPAFKGLGRMPATDAFNSEASQLQDAELDLRMGNGSKCEKVFSNSAFECDSAFTTPPKLGSIKMNSFFEDASARSQLDAPRSQRRGSPDNTPERGRAASGLRRGPSGEREGRTPVANPNGGTRVQAFSADDDDAPIVARTKAAPSSSLLGRSVSTWEADVKHLIASQHRADAVFRPAPSEGLIKCYVKRVKNFFGTHCSFQMHLENGDVFLLAARRRKKSKVSSYVISQSLEDLKRDTDNCLAKLKANFTGTEYMLWGKSDDPHVNKGYAHEQLCINFKQAGITSSGGPRTMFSVLPLPEAQWQPSAPDGSDSLSNSLEMARHKELPPYLERKMAMLCTKPCEWDENLKAYMLDFKGRVKEASVKNFQLVHWDHNTDRRGPDVMLQFGKIEDDLYALDFAYPMNIEVAFAIALASIDTKLCYAV